MSFSPYVRSRFRSCLAVLAILGLLGCGSDVSETETDAWTVQEDAADLQRTLHVSDNEQFYFGNIRDVAVDDSGRIYVADGQAHHVKILSSDGTFIDSLGTQGRGPGEFERPSQLFFARDDSLFVLDSFYGQLSAFAPNRNFVYRLSLRAARSHPSHVMPSPSGFIGEYSWIGKPNPNDRRRLALRRVTFGGTPDDTLLTLRPPQTYSVQMEDGIRAGPLPFGRSPSVNIGPSGLIHSAWSDSSTVRTYSQTGQPRDTVDIPYKPIPVTEADRERVRSEMSAESKAAVQNKIPSTKPAFTNFLVDDEGRYWFGRPTATPDSTTWWIVRPDDNQVRTETLPSETKILTVKEGKAYGRTTTEMGAPALVRYRVRPSF